MTTLSLPTAIAIGVLSGSLYLAVIDDNYRTKWNDLANIALGGYFAQLVPRKNGES